jgi:tripartite-type tricarboxylate transporter receptor subunit TctC
MQAAADNFYEGRTIKIIVAGSVGGAYDIPSRAAAKYLPKYIPGKPTVIVQNMPAAGGMVGINHVYNVSAKDGTEIGVFNRNTILAPLAGIKEARYEIDKFNWLGTPASYKDDAQVFMIRSSLPQKTIDDLRTPGTQLNIGNTGTAITDILPVALGLNIKVIRGYTSSNLNIALERGEVDGRTLAYANVVGIYPHWIKDKLMRFMIVFGHEKRFPALPDVPTARELARTPQERALVDLVEAPLSLGTPFALPPGVPQDRVALLRKAFMATMEDPEYKAEIAKAKMEYSPRSGQQIQEDLARLSKTPDDVLKTYRATVGF